MESALIIMSAAAAAGCGARSASDASRLVNDSTRCGDIFLRRRISITSSEESAMRSSSLVSSERGRGAESVSQVCEEGLVRDERGGGAETGRGDCRLGA